VNNPSLGFVRALFASFTGGFTASQKQEKKNAIDKAREACYYKLAIANKDYTCLFKTICISSEKQ
jgi:hypothetical protein